MTLREAVAVCKETQDWVRYDGDEPKPMPWTPEKFGEAIDELIHHAERQDEMGNLFKKAEFGDKYETRDGHIALFLRNTGNAEFKFAEFYVKDWGVVNVHVENGHACYSDTEHRYDIVKRILSEE